MAKYSPGQKVYLEGIPRLGEVLSVYDTSPATYRVERGMFTYDNVAEDRLRGEFEGSMAATVWANGEESPADSEVGPGLKAQIAIAAIRGSAAEVAASNHVSTEQVVRWQQKLLDRAYTIFKGDDVDGITDATAVKNAIKDLNAQLKALKKKADELS